MNTKNWFIAAGLAVAIAALSSARADDPLFGIEYPIIESATDKPESIRPSLCLINGELGFLEIHYNVAAEQNGKSLPSLPQNEVVMGRMLVRDGSLLRVVLTDKRSRSETQLAKDGWYVTGDYKSKPPRLTLTKDPTKYAHWTFVRDTKPHGSVPKCHVKNENDLGKDAWLAIGKESVHYEGGREVREPILSFDERDWFWINDAMDGR